MNSRDVAQHLLVEELRQASQVLSRTMGGVSFPFLIGAIRKQLGMSQQALARRAGVPQSTISRVERGEGNVAVATLAKILKALSCDLIMVPSLHDSIDKLRRKQARKIAEKRVRYLKGTMNLEKQEPDSKFLEELLKEEEERLLRGSNAKLWEENG